jgi:hypothetical protein
MHVPSCLVRRTSVCHGPRAIDHGWPCKFKCYDKGQITIHVSRAYDLCAIAVILKIIALNSDRREVQLQAYAKPGKIYQQKSTSEQEKVSLRYKMAHAYRS